MITETTQEYFSISRFGRKHQASFYNVFLQCFAFAKLHKLFQKQHTRQSEIPLVFLPKFPFESAEMSV